jgi:hypothetical protein
MSGLISEVVPGIDAYEFRPEKASEAVDRFAVGGLRQYCFG